MSEPIEHVKNIARDLINLEVNTILKPNMTGRKMPKPRHALIDIAKNYNRKLIELGYPLSEEPENLGSYDSFQAIREMANTGIKTFRKTAKERKLTPVEDKDLIMLFRIKTMSDQIKGIFNSLNNRGVETWDNDYTREGIEGEQPPFPLRPDEIVMIRKIWEMGLEEIAMQTIIQLDGDVITRIQPQYAVMADKTLHELHSQGVSTSLRYWRELINILKSFAQTISQSLKWMG